MFYSNICFLCGAGPSGGEDSDEGSSDEGSSSLYSGSPLMESEDSSEGEPPEITIDPNVDIRFSIEGPGGSVLVIDIFAPELNGSVIYCRDETMGDLVAFFTLMSTRMSYICDQTLVFPLPLGCQFPSVPTCLNVPPYVCLTRLLLPLSPSLPPTPSFYLTPLVLVSPHSPPAVTIVTDPEPGPIFAEEFSNITILCDTQHENINQQHWVVQVCDV